MALPYLLLVIALLAVHLQRRGRRSDFLDDHQEPRLDFDHLPRLPHRGGGEHLHVSHHVYRPAGPAGAVCAVPLDDHGVQCFQVREEAPQLPTIPEDSHGEHTCSR